MTAATLVLGMLLGAAVLRGWQLLLEWDRRDQIAPRHRSGGRDA